MSEPVKEELVGRVEFQSIYSFWLLSPARWLVSLSIHPARFYEYTAPQQSSFHIRTCLKSCPSDRFRTSLSREPNRRRESSSRLTS